MVARPRHGSVAAVFVLLLACGGPLEARQRNPAPSQERQAASEPKRTVVLTGEQDAREVRQRFEEVLKRLPPSVGRVLRIDPSLMGNQSYLATYPVLAAYLQQHPEIIRNPDYYLEGVRFELWARAEPDDPRTQAIRMWRETAQAVTIFSVFLIITLVLTWIVRTLLDYRRWSRVSRVQAEVHTKLLDRFTANEDLLAYIQTPAGRRFLESAPIPTESPARPIGAPYGRILWSVQAGIVLVVGALGLLFVSSRVMQEVAQPLFAVSVLALAVGAGFVVSAVASFLLSRRLGLLEPAVTTREPSGSTGG